MMSSDTATPSKQQQHGTAVTADRRVPPSTVKRTGAKLSACTEIRDEALQILRGLIEHVSVRPAENGLEIEIVGEIAKMIELGIGNKAKQPILDETMSRSVKVVAGVGFVQERTMRELRRVV